MAAGEDVGVLVARLVADTEGLRRDMARAQQTLASNSAKMNRNLARVNAGVRNVSRSFTGMRAVISSAAVMMAGRFVKSQLDAAAAIQHTADAIGFQTESLQTLRFAALQYGQSQTTVDMALQRFSRRIGEAANGTGEFLKTAQQLDLQLRDAQGNMRSNEAILGDFANAIRDASSDQERLAMAFKAFDSEGARPMIMLMERGADGLRDFQTQAKDLGVILDRDAIAKAKNASIQFNVLANTIRTQLMVAVAENSDAWLTFGQNAGWAFQQAIEGAGWLLNKLENLGIAISHLLSGDTAGASTALAGGFDVSSPPGAAGGGGTAPSSFGLLSGGGGGGATGGGGGGLLGQVLQTGQAILAPYQHLPMVVKRSTEQVADILREADQGIVDHFRQQAEKRVRIEQETQGRLQDFQTAGFQHAVNLLSALGTKHKGAAIAALAIQKGLGIAEVLIQSKVAAMRALAELGPVAGPPVAASFLTLGRINAGLIAATGLVQAGQLSRGEGSLGTPTQPLFTQPSSLSSQGSDVVGTAGASVQRAVTVVFQGSFVGWDDQTERAVVAALNNAINGRDQVIIRGESRQAEEIRSGSS